MQVISSVIPLSPSNPIALVKTTFVGSFELQTLKSGIFTQPTNLAPFNLSGPKCSSFSLINLAAMTLGHYNQWRKYIAIHSFSDFKK